MPAKFSDFQLYAQKQFLPVEELEQEIQFKVDKPSEELVFFLEEKYGKKANLIEIDDFWEVLNDKFKKNLKFESSNGLFSRNPSSSAKKLIKQPELTFIGLFVGIALLFTNVRFMSYFLILMNLIYFIFNFFKLILFSKAFIKNQEENYEFLSDDELPIYTILLPLYKEKDPQILKNILKMDYPEHKLDVKVIVEESDLITMKYIDSQNFPPHFHIVKIPNFLPKTKPKACNYAMFFTKGEFVTIFDAEDEPDILQLKKAAAKFAKMPEEIVCLQAKLNFYNSSKNLLTKLFSVEYFSWFNYMLKGLEFFQMPVPLGGTSNHFRVNILRQLLLWDPHNVTEDADMGLKIAYNGFKTASLDSYTMEEAPTSVGVWINQRSRWIKGYMQTYLVQMRHPIKFWKATNWQGLASLHMFIGFSCFSFLFTPILFIASIVMYFNVLNIDKMAMYFIFNALIFISFPILLCYLVNKQQSNLIKLQDIPVFFIFPFYFLLHSIASFKAIWELFFNPYYWDKTPHGVDAE